MALVSYVAQHWSLVASSLDLVPTVSFKGETMFSLRESHVRRHRNFRLSAIGDSMVATKVKLVANLN